MELETTIVCAESGVKDLLEIQIAALRSFVTLTYQN